MKRKYLIVIALILVFVVFAAGCQSGPDDSGTADSGQNAGENSENGASSGKAELYFDKELPDVVMRINGQDVHKEQVLAEYEQMKVLYKSIGIDVDTPEMQQIMQEALLSNTISTVVLIQEADKAGIVITDEQVREKMKEVTAQYPSEEEFKKMLSELSISQEDLEEKIRNQLKTSKFFAENLERLIEENTALNFTEEEKRQMYELFNEKVGGMPDYSDMKEEVDEMLEDNKVQIIVGDYIQDLIDKSEIEFFIE